MWRIRLRPTINGSDATACRLHIKRTDANQQICTRHLTFVACRHAARPPTAAPPSTTPAAAATPSKPSNSRFSTPDKKGSGHFGTVDRFKLVACLLMEGKTSVFYEKAADALSQRFHSTLEPRDYILILRVLSDKARDPPIPPRKLGFILKEAVRRGYLRDFLQPSWSALQSILRSGDYGRVVELSSFLLAAEKTDCAKALRAVEVCSARDTDDQILQRAIQGLLVPRSESPVLHPNRRFFHTRLKALGAMGAIDVALKVITHEMPQSEALCKIFPCAPGWNPTSTPGRNSTPSSPVLDHNLLTSEGTGDHLPTHIRRVQPSDITPTVFTYLLVARAAFNHRRYDVSLSMYLSALRAAEKDWIIKQPHMLRYLNMTEKACSLDAMDSKLFYQIRDLHQILCEYYSHEVGEDDHVIADELHAAPTTLSAAHLDKAKLTFNFKSLNDLPSFLYLSREDMWKLMWSLSVHGRSIGAAKGTTSEQLHLLGYADDTAEVSAAADGSAAADLVACMQKELPSDAATYLALKQVGLYAKNPTWMKAWILGPAPASLHIHWLNPKGAPSPSHIEGKNYSKPPESPAEILTANPSATLELLLRYLSSQHAYQTLLQIYTQSILAVYREVNQEPVQALIQGGQVESLDAPAATTLATQLKSWFRMKITAACSALPPAPPTAPPSIFTVATLPPALQFALPPLSPLAMSTITYAYMRTSAMGSLRQEESLQNLASRAYINSLYQQAAQPPPGSLQAFYQASALTPQYVLAFLQVLPNSAYMFSKQVVDNILKGILLPMQEYQERMSIPADTSGTVAESQLSVEGIPRVFHIESPTTRGYLQQVYHELMKKYFSVRRYSGIITVYENEQLLHHQPSLPLSVQQSLLMVQAYMWVGNVSQSLELFDECFPQLNPAQKIYLTAFVCHFLETHVVKSIQQQRGKNSPLDDRRYASLPADPNSKLPFLLKLPPAGRLSTQNVLSMGSPILSPFSGPAYRTGSGFTILGSTSPDSLMSMYESSELDAEARHVESWKRALTEITLQRTTPTSRHVREQLLKQLHATASEYPPVDFAALFDDVEFLQPSMHRKKGGPTSHLFGYLPPNEKEAPQGGHFSFGMESPAFSSYATNTGVLALRNADSLELDPLIYYQMTRIQSLLERLLAQPELLYFNPTTNVCDLRSGVSYNRGRCIIYLLSLWIKYQQNPGALPTGDTKPYEFLVPRSLLKQGHAEYPHGHRIVDHIDSQWYLSDLEHIMLHSYSAEFILLQYFRYSEVTVVEASAQKLSNPSAQQLEEKKAATKAAHPTNGVDAFGRPISEQAYVSFKVFWP